MDFLKVWDQAVREIKREVNLKVLKVPEIEQKVLDATSDEPWGPHGMALSEIAHATKKFTECQLVMNVLWNRLTDTGPNWRHVYKALSVIEYLVANGSERALDDILEHSYQISSISGFEYVEPNGKDVGINVRKKVETILALLDNGEKIQAARDKATANREKYCGLSSTGITYKSSSASYGSGSSYGTYHRGASGSKETGSFKGSSTDRDRYGYTVSNYHNKDGQNKSDSSLSKENEGIKVRRGVSGRMRDQDSLPSIILKPSIKPTLTPKSSIVEPSSTEDDFDDFDPRGFSAAASTGSDSKQVDLFAQSMIGDLMDASTSIPTETTSVNNVASPEVDLFAEATFISASPQSEAASASHSQGNVDLFACQSDFNNAVNHNVDFFAASNPDLFPKNNESSKLEPANVFDPFAAVPLNNFEESALFGAFTTPDPVSSEHTQNPSTKAMHDSEQVSSPISKPTPKKDTSQIKSAIWADSLSRGLIDLNITSPKKESPRAIGTAGSFSNFGQQQEQFGTFKR